MARCLTVAVACWLGAALWLSRDSRARPDKNHFDHLEIYLCFAYTLVPLAAAAAAAIVCGTRMSKPWWIRGPLAAGICSAIVILFFMQTRQGGTQVQPIEIAVPLVAAAAGFLIGVSAPRTEGHTDNPLLR